MIKKTPIKILILTKSIDGGTGVFALSFEKLNKTSFHKLIAILEEPSFRKTQKNNFIFFRKKSFYPKKYDTSIKNIKIFFQDLFWLKRILEKTSPDIILGVDIHCNLIIAILKTFIYKNVKIILTTHINLDDNISQRSDPLLKFLLRIFVRLFYNQADSLVFVSKQLAEDCTNKFKLKTNLISVIYNGISIIKNNLHSKRKNNNTIISIARLVEQKDHLNLIKAFSLLLKKIPDAKLWLLSDGPERKNLERYAKKIKIQNKIKFFGWVKNIYPYLKKASIFAFSSKREGFAIALLEAMACGLPVISTDTPFGPREILDNGKYGILVPMKNPEIMAKAMYELLTNKKKYQYYSQKSLERVKYFSLEKMLKAYKKLILEVLNK